MTLILNQSIFTDGKSKIYRTSSITNQKKRNRNCWLQKKTSSSAEVEAPKSKISCDMRRPKKSRFWPLFIRDTNLLQNIFFYHILRFCLISRVLYLLSLNYLFPNSRERTTVRINVWYSVNVWHIMQCNVEIAKIIPKQTNIDTTITYLIRPFCDFFSKMMSFNIMLKSTHHLMELILQFAGIASAKKREREREKGAHTL